MKYSAFNLEDLIAPLSVQQFFREYWQSRFCHLQRWQERSFSYIFSLKDVDRWLTCVRNDVADSVVLTPPEGADRQVRKYRPQDISLNSAYEAFSKGYSIVLNRLEYSWPPIASAAKSLGEVLCAEIGVNVYLTPKGSRAFPVHVDDHDVFVLQVSGEKDWQLHELRQLSVMRLEFKKDLSFSPDWGPERLRTPMLAELTLRPGDVLYIPRGMPHCAVAKESTSLHITVSITPLYWTDFLKAAVEQASVHAPELRLALPLGLLGELQGHEEMRCEFESAFAALKKCVSYEETLEVIMRNRVRVQGYPLDGHFGQLNGLNNLALDSLVEKREGILCYVENCKSEPGSSIRFSTSRVRGPGHAFHAFEFIRDASRFLVSDLPDLSDQDKLALVRKLICEGLLRFA